MSSISNVPKQLNTSGGNNKLRYQSTSTLAKTTSANIKSSISSSSYNIHNPDTETISSGKTILTSSSFFATQLAYFYELNLTKQFKTLHRKLYPLTRSLPEILIHFDTIIENLITSLTEPNSQSNASHDIVNLIGVLARDTQSEFKPTHFHSTFQAIIKFGVGDGIDNPILSQESLKTLNFLIKYSYNSEAENGIDKLRIYYSPLIGHRKVYIRNMAAEVFSMNLRRCKHPKDFKKHFSKLMKAVNGVIGDYFDPLSSSSPATASSNKKNSTAKKFAALLDGVARLLFHTVKGTANRLQSKASMFFDIIFKHSLQDTNVHVEEKILKLFVLLCCRHLQDGEFGTAMVTSLFTIFSTPPGHSNNLITILLRRIFGYRSGSMFDGNIESTQIVTSLSSMLTLAATTDFNGNNRAFKASVLDLIVTVWKIDWKASSEPKINDLNKLMQSKILPSMSILITNDKVVASTLACDLLPHMEEGVGKEELMSSLMSFAGNDLQICNKILDNNDGRITLGVTGSAKLYGLIVDVLETKNASSSANSDFDLALMTLPNLVKGEHFSAKQIEKLTKVLQSNPNPNPNPKAITCLIHLLAKNNNTKKLNSLKGQILSMIHLSPSDYDVVKCGAAYFKAAEADTNTTTNSLVTSLGINLCSSNKLLRQKTLELLCAVSPKSQVLLTMLQTQQLEVSLSNERNFTLHLSKLEILGRNGKIEDKSVVSALCNFLLGMLTVKLSSIWPAVLNCFAGLNEHYVDEVFGPYKECLVMVMSRSDVEEEGEGEEDAAAEAGILKDSDAQQAVDNIEKSLPTTDNETYKGLVLECLERAPRLMLSKSKVFVPVFFDFLSNKFYAVHSDDPDGKVALMAESEEDQQHELSSTTTAVTTTTPPPLSSIKSVSNSLRSWLKILSGITSPKQLYKCDVVLKILTSLLSSADSQISTPALSAIFRYKLPHVKPYVEILGALVSVENFRESMTKFDWRSVPTEHADELVKILTRIMFGKLKANNTKGTSKRVKDTPATRRVAILSFMTNFEPHQCDELLFLMLRQFETRSAKATQPGFTTLQQAKNFIDSGNGQNVNLSEIAQSRLVGFLNLLRDVMGKMGHQVVSHVGTFLNLLLKFLEYSESGHSGQPGGGDMKAIRSLTYKSFITCFETYNTPTQTHDLTSQISLIKPRFNAALSNSLSSLLLAIENQEISNEAPSLLQLMVTISKSPTTIILLTPSQTKSIFDCLSPSANAKSLDCVLSFVENLLDDDDSGLALISLEIKLFVEQCVKLIEAGVASDGNVSNKVLRILFAVCDKIVIIENKEIAFDSKMVNNMCSLLIPFLLGNKKEAHKLKILLILNTFISNLDAEDAKSLWAQLAKRLGPDGRKQGETNVEVRQGLATTIERLSVAMGGGEGSISSGSGSGVGQSTIDLNAFSKKRLGERDFSLILPVVNTLGTPEGWLAFVVNEGEITGLGVRVLLPLVFQGLHSIFDDDGVVNRGWFAGLKALVRAAGIQGGQDPSWHHLLETTVMPLLKSCLSTNLPSARKLFLLIIREAAIVFRELATTNPLLFGDLNCLVDEEDQEVDFFLNLTHVQVHRRSKALIRLKTVLESAEGESIGQGSLVNVLMPLASHPLHETVKNSEINVALSAVSAIGAISKRLTWGKYHGVLHSLLVQIPRCDRAKVEGAEKERYLIGALCAVLDGFHFEIGGCNGDDESDKIKPQLTKIIGLVDALTTVQKTDKKNETVTELRSPIILALLSLYKSSFSAQVAKDKYYGLIQLVANALKSKESSGRESARKTLGRMGVKLGWEEFGLIVHVLSVTLNNGYMLDVRSSAVHSLLLAMDGAGVEGGFGGGLALNKAVPAVLDVVGEDLFGEAGERRDVKGDGDVERRRVIQEAVGKKGYDIVEILCRNLQWGGEDDVTIVHKIAGSFLARLSADDGEGGVKSSVIKKVEELMSKVVQGLVKNKGVGGEGVLKFVYATLHAAMSKGDKKTLKKKQKNKKKKKRRRKKGDAEEEEEEGEEEEEEEEEESDYSDLELEDEDTEDLEMAINISSRKSKSMMKSSSKKISQIEKLQEGQKKSSGDNNKDNNSNVKIWLPSSKNVESQKSAIESKKRARSEFARVLDGAQAPKLTGWGRFGITSYYKQRDGAGGEEVVGGDMSSGNKLDSVALVFSLNLLYSCLKKGKVTNVEHGRMMEPYLFVLSRLTKKNQEDGVISGALGSLNIVLKWDNVSGTEKTEKMLGRNCLGLVTSSVNVSIQAALYKCLTQLMSSGHIVLDGGNMKTLLNVLHERVQNMSESHVTIMGLIGKVINLKVVNLEVYEVMETVAEMVVTGNHENVRQSATNVMMNFLITYPLGNKKVVAIVNKMLKNCGYEYEEGRLSGIGCLGLLLNKLPEAKLEEISGTVFLQSVLLLGKEGDGGCREGLRVCLETLFRRLGNLDVLWDYLTRWIGTSDENVQNVCVEVLGILVMSRVEFVRGKREGFIVGRLLELVRAEKNGEEGKWSGNFEIVRNCISTLKVMIERGVLGGVSLGMEAWSLVVNLLAHYDLRVKQIAGEIVIGEMRSKGQGNIVSNYEIARNFTRMIDAEIDNIDNGLELVAIEGIVRVMNRMKRGGVELNASGEEEKGVNWLFKRLAGATRTERKKRIVGFKCFLGIVLGFGEGGGLGEYAEIILEPVVRAMRENENEVASQAQSAGRKGWHKSDGVAGMVGGGGAGGGGEGGDKLVEVCHELLAKLEEKLGVSKFLEATTNVRGKLRQRSSDRKEELAVIKATDSKLAAEIKNMKREKERNRVKRRMEEKKEANPNKRGRHN